MKFDCYFPIKTKTGLVRPGVTPKRHDWGTIRNMLSSKTWEEHIDKIRAEVDEDKRKELKDQLPAICFVGECMKTRANKWMRPTQAVMIDIDHVEEPRKAFEEIKAKILATKGGKDWWYDSVLLWAITPSGKGLRAVMWAQVPNENPEPLTEEDPLPSIDNYGGFTFHDLPCQMDHFNRIFNADKYGTFDSPCKDFARISFFFKGSEILFENAQLLTEVASKQPQGVIINKGLYRKELSFLDPDSDEEAGIHGESDEPQGFVKAERDAGDSLPTYTEDEEREIQTFDYCGTPLAAIIKKYVESVGKPSKGQVHNYYNDLIKNFRNIANNDKRVLFYLLPRFGHPAEECWSQIVSICRVNTLSSLPKSFYFFLKDNGFYKSTKSNGTLAEYMLAEGDTISKIKLPWLPPVFKQLLGTAPDDFKVPLMNALLPIMGTLTSCIGARYYYGKNEYHTTSFFSVIYAPAGTGKGFCSDYMDILFKKLKQRDYIQNAREQIFLNEMSKKGANDKSPDDPHTSLRIIYPKNSEAEFLQKQKDNHGYHMFTFAAEMDSWAKGVKAAGGNKDDMLRIAWDNGDYGQNFKSANTVKGGTNLYWNVLITGTLPQVQNYFKNVENGLVTRTSFCSIDNQEFATAPKWKELTPKQREVVDRFIERCDRRSYAQPCNLFPEDIDSISPKDFDKNVDWKFSFLPRQTVNMEWLRPTIESWLQRQLKLGVKDFNKARDVFRRRVAVRGFRLGMICTMLWENPKPQDLKKCCPFIEWWMNNDIENMMKLWGDAYNQVAKDTPTLSQKSLFNMLGETFTKNDVLTQCMKMGISTPVRCIISNWKRFGFVTKKEKNLFTKVKRNDEGSGRDV